MKTLLTPIVVLALQAATSHAATISVNFTDNGTADSTMAVGDTAGAGQVTGARVANWNNYAANGTSQVAAALSRDSDGNSIATTVAYTGALGRFRLAETQAAPNGDDRMWKGFLDIETGATVTIANIPYANYTVVVYFDGQNSDVFRVAGYNINGGTARGGEDSENTNWKKALPGQNPTGIY